MGAPAFLMPRRTSWRLVDWTPKWARVAVQIQWEPRDLCVGLFWSFERLRGTSSGWDAKQGTYSASPWSLHAYICLVPLLPIHVYIMRTVRP